MIALTMSPSSAADDDARRCAMPPARLRDALADQPLGHDDGEDDDGDDAAGVEQELHGGEELGVERAGRRRRCRSAPARARAPSERGSS